MLLINSLGELGDLAVQNDLAATGGSSFPHGCQKMRGGGGR
jgi:hypothetical protein